MPMTHWPFPESRFDPQAQDLARDANAAQERYLHLLKNHDWTFEYTEDHEVWRRGRAAQLELERLRVQLDPKFVLWNTHAPSGFQRKG